MLNKISITVLLLLPIFSSAQITEKVTIKAGEDISEILSTHGLYLFPDFNTTEVKLKDGSTTRAKMNFNVYMNEIQFIGNKGDTLVIDKPELIDSILFDSATFYYQNGYRQIIGSNDNVKLVLDRKISFQYVKRGALGLPASAGVSVETYGSITPSFNSSKKLIIDEDIIAIKKSSYFLVLKKNKEVNASYSGFLSAFPVIKNDIKEFSDTNNINYKSPGDLKKVFKFCIDHS